MGRKEKLLAKLQQRPKNFTWDELSSLLKLLGYEERKAGKTGGSRRRFVHPTAPSITLHKPHPGRIVKMYLVDNILELLSREEIL